MPNFDGGHYFLTALIPVKTGLLDDVDKSFTSHAHALRSRLARLPPALQSSANEKRGINSPFARNRRTHFARMFVIEDVAFNGRKGSDSLLVAIAPALAGIFPSFAKLNPLSPQTVDQLPNPYLVLVADFDAANGSDSELDGYLAGLWGDMGEDLGAILSHCHGCDGIKSAEAFTGTIRHCQVETTMPFNDYWQGKLDLNSLGLSLVTLAVPPLLTLAALAIGIVGCAVAHVMKTDPAPWEWTAGIGAVGLVLSLLWAYLTIMNNGRKPLPSAPNNDLPSVLKALYIQQNFVRFATGMQGADPATLHSAFGKFLQTHQPADVAHPTQPPGVVRSPLGTV